MKICIDPGHGGNDTGAEGPSGLHESDINLRVSELVVSNLEKIGLETRLTRTCDVFVELGQRCNICNDWVADRFVSIHCNSDGPSAAGIETLYSSSAGEDLAKPIQEMLVTATGDVDRHLVYRSDLYVLNGTDCPACLSEIGFISNPDTEALFKTDPYLKTIAGAISSGIAKHLKLFPPSHPLL